jgi:hypothetical protein
MVHTTRQDVGQTLSMMLIAFMNGKHLKVRNRAKRQWAKSEQVFAVALIVAVRATLTRIDEVDASHSKYSGRTHEAIRLEDYIPALGLWQFEYSISI